MTTIDDLWRSNNEEDWNAALERYWSFVQPKNAELERELDHLQLDEIATLDAIGWYDFLHDRALTISGLRIILPPGVPLPQRLAWRQDFHRSRFPI